MSYKGRYVKIIRDGRFGYNDYKKDEIWLVVDDHLRVVRAERNGKITEFNLYSKPIECELLPEDYKPDQELKTILNKELEINLW